MDKHNWFTLGLEENARYFDADVQDIYLHSYIPSSSQDWSWLLEQESIGLKVHHILQKR